jgi:hypothetical protein
MKLDERCFLCSSIDGGDSITRTSTMCLRLFGIGLWGYDHPASGGMGGPYTLRPATQTKLPGGSGRKVVGLQQA